MAGPTLEQGAYPGLESGTPDAKDPAFQPPSDPLRDQDALRSRVQLIHREIPNVTVQSGWSVGDVRSALVALTSGLFDTPAQLHDAIAGDSRVQSALRSRSGGLLGRQVKFSVPRKFKDDRTARRCLRAWENHWPLMAAEPALVDLVETSGSLGFAPAQLLWDTSRPIWKPYIQSFNARYTYYHWEYRTYVAITKDGQTPITPGDGRWVLSAPYGTYRGWMRGALRALAQWWLARNYALRDWARYCERHGFPILMFDTPFGADPTDIATAQTQLQNIGQESILQVPGSVDLQKYGKYDLRYLEPKDENWQAFKALIDQCNDEITLALLGQNLTTQVKEGSFAAARVHADVRQAILEAEATSLAKTVHTQIARPFAALNFGNADFAPIIEWDVRPQEDQQQKAHTFQAFAQALQNLRTAGFQLTNPEAFAENFGLSGLNLEPVPPVQIEAQLARATGKDDEDAKAAAKKPNDDKGEDNAAKAKPVKPVKKPGGGSGDGGASSTTVPL